MGVRGCSPNGWSLLVSERDPSDSYVHRTLTQKQCFSKLAFGQYLPKKGALKEHTLEIQRENFI